MSRRVGAFGALAAAVAVATGGLGALASGGRGGLPLASIDAVTEESNRVRSVHESIQVERGRRVPGEIADDESGIDQTIQLATGRRVGVVTGDVETASTTTTLVSATATPASSGRVPTAVEVDLGVVDAGGVRTFSGTCPLVGSEPIGPIQVWISPVGGDTAVVITDLTAETWTYEWVAPTDPAEFDSYRFRFWCGDPTGIDEVYPDELVVTVDMVTTGAPPTPPTTAPPTTAPTAPTTTPTTTTPTTTTPTTTTPTTTTTVPLVAQDPPTPSPVVLPETR